MILKSPRGFGRIIVDKDGFLPTRPSSDLPSGTIGLATKGIKALVESIKAFHGLGDKLPVIGNIFGTAHAYVTDDAPTLHPRVVLPR